MSSHRREQKAAVRDRIKKLSSNLDNVYVVHYSCEDFTAPGTLRVTSIAVRHFASGQTASFSIQKSAESARISPIEIKCRLDELEKKMLTDFYTFVHKLGGVDWVHWNMRNIIYGFPALEQRSSTLGVETIRIDESRQFDLSKELVTLYGPTYSDHPRLKSVIKMNKMTEKNLLDGKAEAVAFDRGDFNKLHLSTLRKVDNLCDILERVIDGKLKVKGRWYQMYDIHGLVDMAKNHWVATVATAIVGLIGFAAAVMTIMSG